LLRDHSGRARWLGVPMYNVWCHQNLNGNGIHQWPNGDDLVYVEARSPNEAPPLASLVPSGSEAMETPIIRPCSMAYGWKGVESICELASVGSCELADRTGRRDGEADHDRKHDRNRSDRYPARNSPHGLTIHSERAGPKAGPLVPLPALPTASGPG
jgi:hypothetical protein